MSDVREELERRLRARFDPTRLEIRDDSAKHVGHAGATSGGGHFRVTIVSAVFEGLSLLEQHRAVNDAVADLFGAKVHALGLRTSAPSAGGAGGGAL
jgi:BolA protein